MRFIPAHAGSTRPMSGINRNRRRRFIPAHAGSTDTATSARELVWVHPRACGEHEVGSSQCLRRFIPAHAGSTRGILTGWVTRPVHPRACGEHSAVADKRHRHRFIPAHAGSTPPIRQRRVFGSSPRMRGAQAKMEFSTDRFIPAHAGSTLRRSASHERRVRRFIPAHAGSTSKLRKSRIFHGPVHPRACGEHSAMRRRETPVHPRACGEHFHTMTRCL